MSFLRLNGVVVNVFNTSVVRRVSKKGTRSRSMRGVVRSSERWHRRSWQMSAVVKDDHDARALEALISGEGHSIDFSAGPEASTSLMPLPGYESAVRFLPSSWGPHGRGVCAISASFTGVALAYDAQLDDDNWTAIWTRQSAVGGAWIRYVQTAGRGWYYPGYEQAGLALADGGSGLYVRSALGVLEVVKDSASAELLGGLQILPFRLSDDVAQEIVSQVDSGSVKWGPSPFLRADGDFFPDGAIIVDGEVLGVDIVSKPATFPGVGWISSGRVVNFRITEVDPAFFFSVEQESATPTIPTTAAGAGPIFDFDAANVDGRHNATLTPGAAISAWVNVGSFGVDLAQATGANQPTFQMVATRTRLEDSPAVRFDGSDDRMDTSGGGTITGPVTVAVVWRARTVGAGDAYVLDRLGAFAFRLFRNGSTETWGAEANTVTHATALTADSWNASTAVLKSSGTTHRLNGVEESEATDMSDTAGSGDIRLGMNGSAASPGDVDIARVLVWDGEVSLDEIDAYIAARYGATPD